MTDSDGGAPDEKVLPFANPQQKRKGSPPPGVPSRRREQARTPKGSLRAIGAKTGRSGRPQDPKRNPRPIRLCSDMRAVHTESGVDGRRWAINVEVVDKRGDS